MAGFEVKKDVKHRITNVVRNVVTKRGLRLNLICALAIVIVFYLWTDRSFLDNEPTSDLPEINAESRYFHVLVPADRKDENLVKTLVSAAACDYPVPTLINWGAVFNESNMVAGGSHIAKITGVLDWLNSQPTERDDDLVLLVDGLDTWLQLRPEVLIMRYLDVNRRANSDLELRFRATTMKEEGIQQSVIFSAQKRCWPRAEDDPACYAVPESTLPTNVYGPQTDTDVGNEENPYVKYRQRYLNSGIGMGDVRGMRKLFTRALSIMDKDRNFGSDQNIFAQMFGEQEYQREVIRQRHFSTWERFLHKILIFRKSSSLDQHPTHVRMEPAPGASFEFGIGLDYESLLGHPTVFAEYDSEWIRHNDTTNITEGTKTPSTAFLHVKGPSADILKSRPPFVFGTKQTNNSWHKDLDWNNLPLLTNLWTGISPVVIHHNAHIHDMKTLRQTSWPLVWFQPYLRTLLDQYTKSPYHPITTGWQNGKKIQWWPMDDKKVMIKTANLQQTEISLRELLDGYEEEIFRDGKGQWRTPGLL